MKDIYEAFKYIGIDLGLLLSGLFGGVAFLSKPNDMTRWQKFFTVFAGIGTANYVTPIVIYITRIPDQFGYGLGFILGTMGLKAVSYIITRYKLKQNDKN